MSTNIIVFVIGFFVFVLVFCNTYILKKSFVVPLIKDSLSLSLLSRPLHPFNRGQIIIIYYLYKEKKETRKKYINS